ncbi:endonuclease III [Peptoniphilus sp. SGI.035]|uniref:endonuclease III n=1 Tax=unclassified Peptoniphilus TaxID=2637196 RepID=UPI0025CB8906|nr:endonuclease III [Peptoniphilus sp.]MCI5643253.1 endonuclease III [Peptoniphilus sp.]MDD7352590.1 endonuclease III [Peptoniphilaceae bacterium]MDY3902993.1 endonuclease III [Peptoniphilus sp.]
MKDILTHEEAEKCLDILEETYPDAHCELEHNSPYELLVATILSAQCTDIRVNKVTSEMFKKYNTPKDFAYMDIKKLEGLIKECGIYRNKAKNIKASSSVILEEYNGEVPNTIEELMKLPGVGKKTANVVASTAFGVPAIAVDTHVFRVSNRIGFVHEKNVEATERALQNKIDKNRWTKAHHLFIFHGRRCCTARNPKCEICTINKICRYYEGDC